MNKTKIEWADFSWNPITGCLNNCEYCYARIIAHRFAGFEPRCGGEEIPKGKGTCPGSIYNSTHNETLHIFNKAPLNRTNRGYVKTSYPYDFDLTFHRYKLDEPQKIKKPQNIFVGSMTDIFGEWIPDEWIREVFTACVEAPQHNYLFLTKNPKKTLNLNIPKKFWLGATITGNGGNMDFIEGENTFVSLEPLQALPKNYDKLIPLVKWVIIGAETGNRKNKIVPEKQWIDNIVEVAKSWCTPVFMKESLLPIMGEENMLREFPKELIK